MRAFSTKGICAFILGTITPIWLIWGFEISTPVEWNFPDVGYGVKEFISKQNTSQLISLLILVILSITYLIGGLMKSINYNGVRRAASGYLSLLTLTVLILLFIDVPNSYLYLTLLEILTSFSIYHYFFSSVGKKPVWPFISYPLIFIGMAIWNFL